MSEVTIERNSPVSLTPKQMRTVNLFVTKFGENHTQVKRGDLRKAAKEILSTEYAPAWMVCNKNIQVKDKRGLYDLSMLTSLPVVEKESKSLAKEKKVAAPKKAVKKEKAPVVEPKKKVTKTKKKKDVVEDTPVENVENDVVFPPHDPADDEEIG